MRYFFIVIFAILIISSNAQSEDQTLNKVKEQLEIYQKKCYNEAFSKEEIEKDVPLFGIDEGEMYANLVEYWGSMKQAEQDYSACMKEIIVNKIDTEFPEESQKEMKDALEEIQSGILKLYWNVHNSQDNGLIGRLQNDAAMSRVYDNILEDIIHYLTVHGKLKGWGDHTLLP